MLEVDVEREWDPDGLRECEEVNVTGELKFELARELNIELVDRGDRRAHSAGSVTALCIGGLVGYGANPGGFRVLDKTLRWRFGPPADEGSKP